MTMSKVKFAVIYYNATGTNHQMAKEAQAAAVEAGAEVRLRRIRELAPPEAIARNPKWKAHLEATADVPEAALEDLEWADAIIFGAPSRFGNVASQVKQFLDTTGGLWYEGKLANKVVSAFTSAQNPHGGQESTLLALNNTFYHWGAILVPPGYLNQAVFAAGGNPYGVSSNADGKPVSAEVLEAVRFMTRRVLEVTGWLLAGRAGKA